MHKISRIIEGHWIVRHYAEGDPNPTPTRQDESFTCGPAAWVEAFGSAAKQSILQRRECEVEVEDGRRFGVTTKLKLPAIPNPDNIPGLESADEHRGMEHRMTVEFILTGDDGFPVRFLEWLAIELGQGNTGTDYVDERVKINRVDVDGRTVVGVADGH